MAVIQIPNLPVAISLSGQELVEIVQGGVSRRCNTYQIASLNFPALSPLVNGYVTTYQFLSALAAYPADVNILYLALDADLNQPATIQFYTSPYVSKTSPLYALTHTTYPSIDMDLLFLQAAAILPWG